VKEAIAEAGMGRKKINMWLKMDSGAADAKMFGGFGDGVLFGHASLYHNSSRVEQHKFSSLTPMFDHPVCRHN
jgi:hypothetical protein